MLPLLNYMLFFILSFHDWEAAMLNEIYTEKLGVDLATFIARNQVNFSMYYTTSRRTISPKTYIALN
jgi:hypothetical protein